MNSNFTWTLDLLNNLWTGIFGLFFLFLIVFHVYEAIEDHRRKKERAD